jgi:hypothetical protein
MTAHRNWCRNTRSALLATAFVFGMVPVLLGTGLQRTQGGRVFFIPLSDLAAQARAESLSAVPPHQKASILDTLALPESKGCVHLIPSEIDRMVTPVRDSLEQGARGAEGILLGRVVEATPGFSDWDFGTLLRIEVREILKGASWLSRKQYLAFVPIGSGEVDGKRYCQEPPAWTKVPSLDSQVLLFISSREEVSETYIDVLDDGGLVVVSDAQGAVQLPRRYLSSAGALAKDGSESLLRAVRAWSLGGAK